jgi:catechol 2,3-dioxygenase-like lactoylglutathione lyase family enzyme
MIDHIGISTANAEKIIAFYTGVLATLGIEKKAEYPGSAGYGRGDKITFWIGHSELAPSGMHLAFSADSHRAVDAFYQAALAAGASDNGEPGLRPHYHENYYAAFVVDPDGNNIEAVCHNN